MLVQILVQAPDLIALDWEERLKDRHGSWLMLPIVLNHYLRSIELESEDVQCLHEPLKSTGIEDRFKCTFA